MRRILASLALATLLAPVAAGQGAAGLGKRFGLFNACRPMMLVVEELSSDAAAIGLAREDFLRAAESRLRGARLYVEVFWKASERELLAAAVNDDKEKLDAIKAKLPKGNPGDAVLYLQAIVIGRAVSLSVEYKKKVTDEFGVANFATTWESTRAGMTGTGTYIVSELSRLLDEFLAAYLRVNEEVCGSPTAPLRPAPRGSWRRPRPVSCPRLGTA